MSEPGPGREPEPVDETGESAKLYVADPDDYAKTRKLKAINDAKAYVQKVRRDRPATAGSREWEGLDRQLAEAVASYGHELLPLAEKAEQVGTIDTEDYYTRSNTDIRSYILADGHVEADGPDAGYEIPEPPTCMAVCRQLERIQRKLGLGLDLEEQTDDEWEIQT